MDPNPTQITHDIPPFFRVHSTGHVERYYPHDFLPPSHDPQTGVVSRDVVISPENNVSARLYLPPQTPKPDLKPKPPLIVYIHGGGFSLQSAFSSAYHPYLNTLSSKSGSVVVSVEYRLAPEHPIPACYEDSWSVIKWVESHSQVGQGPDPWLNGYVDFDRVYLAGDSAGANIAHNMAIRAGNKDYTGDGQFGVKLAGLALIHPFFGNDGGPDKLWDFICPDTTGSSKFMLDPGADMDLLSKMGCHRVLVCVAENDFLRERGLIYYETLKKSDWKGEIELFETPGEGHVFHLRDSGCDKASLLLDRLISFVMI